MDPDKFGKYRILSKLSGGGMGRVFLAEDTETRAQVALKLIDQMPDEESQEVLEAERRGAMLQARLCALDPRVALIYDIGEENGYLYIVMEYVAGEDLSELIKRGPMDPGQAVRIAASVCGVLANAHTFHAQLEESEYQGIVHGDIKPRNIRITPDGQVKVLDFGIAKALTLTRKFTRNQFGSVPYSSPERLNTGEVDTASDVWSVGVVLYEMLVGMPYFRAENPSKLENVVRSYAALNNSFDRIPGRLRGIMGKALDPNPQRRYESANALQQDLTEYLDTLQDMEATRRTSPLQNNDEVTRRTGPVSNDATRRTVVQPVPAVAAPVKPAAAPAKPAVVRAKTRIPALARWGLLGFMCTLVYLQGRVIQQGGQLARDLEADKVSDLGQAWDRYHDIASHLYVPFGLGSARKALTERLTASANRTISEYRDNDTTVYQKEWQAAQASLARALELDSSDKDIRGKLRLCEGHVSRINAGNVQGRNWNDAKAKFEEAHDLMPKSPDPYLGLARLYTTAKDLDKAEDLLHEAERHGYKIGKRDKAQLADAYRSRGELMLAQAPKLPGFNQQQDSLGRADTDLARAEGLYRDIAPYGSSMNMLQRVANDRTLLSQRKQMLKELDNGHHAQ